MWECPHCSRKFRNVGQWHSCVQVSVDAHLKGKSEAITATYHRIVKILESSGDIRVTAVKGSISIAARSVFCTVKILMKSIRLEFLLPRMLENPRLDKVIPVSSVRFLHMMTLNGPNDVDEELIGWLQEAKAANST
jgi:hypothetical protein